MSNERVRVEDRRTFSYDEKVKILQKSHGLCSHCGKRIEVGGRFTVEHIIPLSKGGTNKESNLVGLCIECNKDKGSMVVDPINYYTYLDSKYYSGIIEAFEKYTKEYRYISRNNVLSVDLFTQQYNNLDHTLNSEPKSSAFINMRRGDKKAIFLKNGWSHTSGLTVKRVVYSDMDELYNFYISQARKQFDGSLDSIKKYIKSCLSRAFCKMCIYLIKNSSGDIVSSFFVQVVKDNKGIYTIVLDGIQVKYDKYISSLCSVFTEFIGRFLVAVDFEAVPIILNTPKSKLNEKFLWWFCQFDKDCYIDLEKGMTTIMIVGVSDESMSEEERLNCLEENTSEGSDYQKWLREVFSIAN